MYSDVRFYAHDEASVGAGYSSSDSAIRIPRILIVENDATDSELLRDLLTREGFAASSRSDIQAALDILSVEPFEVVVVNLGFETDDGEPLFRVIQRAFPRLAVVVTMGDSNLERAVDAMRQGAMDYICKPFRMGVVVNRVRHALDQIATRVADIERSAARSLYGLADRLGSSVDFVSALRLMANTVYEQTNASRVSISIDNAIETKTEEIAAGRSPHIVSQDLTNTARAVLSSVIVSGPQVFDFLELSQRTETITSLLLTPLRSGFRTLGWITATRSDKGVFTEGERKLVTIVADRAAVAAHNVELTETIDCSFRSTAEALIAALEEKDQYTAGHSERVADIARCIAVAMGLPDEEVERVHQGGRLHDIGKLAIRTEDLNKPGPLTDEEYARMKLHTVTGEHLLRAIPLFQSILPAVGSHHERLDGTGYPRGLKGDQIPLIARIVAVADAYDAMTSDRAYRAAMSHQEAVEELLNSVGSHFDGRVVDALIRALETPIPDTSN